MAIQLLPTTADSDRKLFGTLAYRMAAKAASDEAANAVRGKAPVEISPFLCCVFVLVPYLSFFFFPFASQI